MGPLARLGVASRRGFGRITPDPLVLAVALSLLVFVAAVAFGDWPGATVAGGTGARMIAALEVWGGGGLWRLLAFAMQAVLMLVLGTALAEAPVIRRGLGKLAQLARGPRGLVALTAFVSIGLALFSWSLSLIGAALLARAGGRHAEEQGWGLHYPLLCAAAYSGLMCWHGGLSGTAPLKATTQKDLVEVLGPELAARVGPLGLDQTLFSSLNLLVCAGLLVLGPLLFALLTPRRGQDPAPEPPPRAAADERDEVRVEPGRGDGLERLERSPLVTWALGLPLAAALVIQLVRRGPSRIDLDTINLALWVFALLLHGRPHRFVEACAKGLSRCTGIVLQFPLYAAIMALMASSGLSVQLTAMVSAAGSELLAVLTFFSAGLLNLLVPSGGGQ